MADGAPQSRLRKAHQTEGSTCPACEGADFPLPCQCGGDIHAEHRGTPRTGEHFVWECDRCGHKYQLWPDVTPIPDLPRD